MGENSSHPLNEPEQSSVQSSESSLSPNRLTKDSPRKSLGTWSGEALHDNTSKLPRRDFLKQMGTAVASLVVGETPLKHLPRLTERQQGLDTKEKETTREVKTMIVDFFSAETTEENLERILEGVDVNLNIDDISYDEIGSDDPFQQPLQIYNQLKDFGPVTRVALNTVLEVVSNHGEFVSNSFFDQVDENQQVDVTRVGLQNALENMRLESDLLGNLHLQVDLSRQRLNQILEQNGVADTDVLVGAFQLGQIEASYSFFKFDPKTELLDDYNLEKVVVAWGETVEQASIIYLRPEGDGFVVVATMEDGTTVEIPEAYYAEYTGDYNDMEAITQFDNFTKAEITENIELEIQERGSVPDHLIPFIKTVPKNERIDYREPYNQSENLNEFYQFCRDHSDLIVVQAAGNNTILEDDPSSRPKNGLLVTGVGGEARRRIFGTDVGRNIGGIRSDIYVNIKEFHESQTTVMTASESTGILGYYVEELLKYGVEKDQIKQILQDNCCDYYVDGKLEPNSEPLYLLQESEDTYATGFLFNKIKAEAYIESLQ